MVTNQFFEKQGPFSLKEIIPYLFVFFNSFVRYNRLCFLNNGLISKSKGCLSFDIFNKLLSNGISALLFLLILLIVAIKNIKENYKYLIHNDFLIIVALTGLAFALLANAPL